MNIINSNNYLLLHPSLESDVLTNTAIKMIAEITGVLDGLSFADAETNEIRQIIRLTKRGISQITTLENKYNVLSLDALNAERILNDTLRLLVQQLNDAISELRIRAYSKGEYIAYITELSTMIDTLIQWSDGGRASMSQHETTTLAEADHEYL